MKPYQRNRNDMLKEASKPSLPEPTVVVTSIVLLGAVAAVGLAVVGN